MKDEYQTGFSRNVLSIRAAIIIFFLFLWFVPTVLIAAEPSSFEHLEYRLSWNRILSVGRGSLEMENDGATYVLTMTARSVKPIDFFFKIRDWFRCRVSGNFTSFISYEKKVREGRYRRHDQVFYDQQTGKVVYVKNGKTEEEKKISPPLYDPFSVLYAYRYTCSLDKPCELLATDGKHLDQVTIVPQKKETVKVPAGKFDCCKVEPVWKRMQGVFRTRKGGYIHIWFTDDEKRIPVKMEAKIFLGKVVAELVQCETRVGK